MVIKWAGIGLVLFSGTGWGMWLAWRWKARLEALETLRQMVFGLKGEITYSRAPLEEALERVGRRENGFWAVYLQERPERLLQAGRRHFLKYGRNRWSL